MSSEDDMSRSEPTAGEIAALRSQIRALESEVGLLRRKLVDTPKRVTTLEERLLETKGQLAQAVSQNEKLTFTLREAREHIATLREEVEKLTQPPSAYGTFIAANDDDTVDVHVNGRKVRVSLHPDLLAEELEAGAEVVLNESMNVVMARDPSSSGEVVTLKEVLSDEKRALVTGRADEDRIVDLGDHLKQQTLRAGDSLLLDVRANLVLERLPRPEVDELLLEEVPNVTYDDIGGLDGQIEQITDAVELPYLHQDLFREYDLPAPKGILLYGPPGCGKTLIAKAVANSLAKKVADASGNGTAQSFFINIKGPELLNKYVGETERQIRQIFQRAREKASEGWPVIVFFDEMESLFRTRGSGISSDMESTVVPQLLAEIDGVEGLRNVIVIGASNREDLIDPAILRPGRLDVKIKIHRPDETAASAIFATYLKQELPLDALEIDELGGGDPDKTVRVMIERTVEEMYRPEDHNRFLEVTYQNGDKEVMYFKDFASGAMIENIVRRSKKTAIKRSIATGSYGIRLDDLLGSIRQEYKEHEDLPNTTNPDDWAKISGKKGERIVFIRTLLSADDEFDGEGGRAIERVQTGQYL
ncbi:MAG: proteasome ATPase [Acidimicrobiaceae bacterium]|jgi:proteasome-associated ATPase|nr:proteasome ATPase [Acidimicrobiaceae bacterium]MEC9114385.1 proteasome ATPase [Actinomycetota bacterium]|tara:strand:- start:724 stop:2493 length:1770 start_codon:yes stop_codon:yes gene_type:complete